jgi:hypothetical protein
MGPVREPGTELFGEPITELAREPEKELTKHSGNWLLRMAQESSYSEGHNGRVRETRALLVGPEQL